MIQMYIIQKDKPVKKVIFLNGEYPYTKSKFESYIIRNYANE